MPEFYQVVAATAFGVLMGIIGIGLKIAIQRNEILARMIRAMEERNKIEQDRLTWQRFKRD